MFQKDTRISILGNGGWGTALALLLAGQGYSVDLWGADPEYVEVTRKKRENIKFLPGFMLPAKVNLVSDVREAYEKADMIVLAIPSQFMRSVLKKLPKSETYNKSFVSVAKGIETKSLKMMSHVIHEELGNISLCVLSGPSIAREVALKMPAAVSAASHNKKLASLVRNIFSTDYFRVYESSDVLGVELGGSVKNVIAILAGIVEGLGLGSNTRAVLFARGVAEMARLGMAMGAKRETFMGLSGLGDLATTCLSSHSRNRWLGSEIGKGKSLKSILKGTEMIVEGVDTTKSTYALAKKYRVSMPITEAVHGILFKNESAGKAVSALMHRKFHRELD